MNKPRIVFDLETTGVDVVKDRIVQIAVRKINIDGTEETKSVLINPTIPIPKAASDVHGILDADIKNAPTFSQIATSMLKYFNGSDLIGFNSDQFDIPLLSEEFNRCGLFFPQEGTEYLDVMKIERMVNSHKLTDTYKRYIGEELDGAHDAMNDVNGTWEVLKKQIEIYNLPNNISEITEKYNNGKIPVDVAGKIYQEDNKYYWSFGKNKGNHVTEDIGYCNWVLKSDFPSESKSKLKIYLEKMHDLDR